MKKVFISILILTLFSSCWENNSSWEVSWLKKEENEKIEISIPTDWIKIEKNDNILPIQQNSNIELAFVSNNINYWFSSNIIILSQEIKKKLTSKDFSILNFIWSKKEFKEFNKLDEKEIKFKDWDESILYTFEAKYNLNTPKLKYLQFWKICNKEWFLITLAITTNIKDTKKHEEIISTFNCK